MEDVKTIRNLMKRVQEGAPRGDLLADYSTYAETFDLLDIFKMILEVKHTEKGMTVHDIQTFFEMHLHLYGHDVTEIHVSEDEDHPLHVLRRENELFSDTLEIIGYLIEGVENGEDTLLETLIAEVGRLGELNRHFNRKEKLYFPLLERYGIQTLPRTIWKAHDHIRALLKGMNALLRNKEDLDFIHIRKSFNNLKAACREVVMEEDYLLIPVTQLLFKERDWCAIAGESSAFGYAIDAGEYFKSRRPSVKPLDHTEQLQFGGGYLTAKEANLILNNLPVEITFIDKSGIFKYFNEVVESSEMMFIRTPLSIGRNVANCHPPKSLKKVMYVIRDLRNKAKDSETMWFKKGDQFIHITYKALFDEKDEFMGILEYVQDIQPFLELPSDMKRNVSR